MALKLWKDNERGLTNAEMDTNFSELAAGGLPQSLIDAQPTSKPSLKLDFTKDYLDPRITFIRTSNAMVTGLDGKLRYAPHNLLAYSEQFDNADWTKTEWSIVLNATTSPDGSLSADRAVRPNTNSSFSSITQNVTVASGTPHTLTCYVKADQYKKFGLREGVATGAYATFNLTTGTIIETSAGSGTSVSASISPFSNGWYRCSLTITFVGTSFGVRLNPLPDSYTSGSPAYNWAGNTTDGIYIWGAQLNVGALQPYYPTTAAAYYGPRFDYDPVTLAPKGLLIEEQRTNLCLHSKEIDSALYAKWQFGIGATPLLPSGTIAAPDGTMSGKTYTLVANIPNTGYQVMTVTANTVYTWSLYVRLGTLPLSDYNIAFRDDTAGVFIAADVVPTLIPVGGGWSRLAYTLTTPAGCVSLRCYPFRSLNVATGGTVSFWGAQLEAGAFPTSYIPTTTAAATRAADVATMTGTNFSSWYRQDAGTLVAEASTLEVGNSSGGAFVLSANDGTGSNLHRIFRQSDSQPVMQTLVGGVAQTTFGFGANWTDTSSKRLAYAYKINDFAGSVNASSVQTDTSGTLPTNSQLDIGNTGGGTQLNGYIRRITYYPRRLTDAELQAITA